jgi:hypothetical protein
VELIVGLVVIFGALAAVVFGLWFAVRALTRTRRHLAPAPAGPRSPATELRLRLRTLQGRGFTLDDDGGAKIILRLPLVEASSRAGHVSMEYRIVLKLDEASGTARLSERRTSEESGFGGAGVASWSVSKSPTAGARALAESGAAAAPGGSGGNYRLDAVAARALVEETIAGAGWRLG